jgi:NAD(P)-dependent dehydrogenase (short-subunit alcohol dehydrogenase family)
LQGANFILKNIFHRNLILSNIGVKIKILKMIIKDKIFLVTGAASGLGFATAQMIADNKGYVLMADVNTEGGQAAEKTLGKRAKFVKTDVTDEKSVQKAIDTAVKKWGTLHGVVNCAGIAPGERVLGKNGVHTLATFTRVIQINLIGTFNVLRLATAVMQNNEPITEGVTGERGVIINTASVAAFEGQIGQAAYSASKGGVVGMTLPIARELARVGIRIMAIAPGIFETPMLLNLSPELQKSLGEQVPFPSRLGKPEEYAALVKHIIENQMLNGSVIRLDGAIRMGTK